MILYPVIKVLRVVEVREAAKALHTTPLSFTLTFCKQASIPSG